MPCGIDRTPSTFELELFPCEVDDTLMAVGEVKNKNRFKYSVFNREQDSDEEEVKTNNPYGDIFSNHSSFLPPLSLKSMDRMNDQEKNTFYGKQSSTSRSSDEHTASDGSDEDIIERSAK